MKIVHSIPRVRLLALAVLFAPFLVPTEANGLEPVGVRKEAIAAMKRASVHYRQRVARHGGYVYFYSLDLNKRWGEGQASADQIWIQPPGTPTVGLAFVRAYEATGDKFYLDAATDAALAVIQGQLKSGGWTNSVDFDPRSPQTAAYRNGKGRGKNNSTLDEADWLGITN